MPPSLTAEPGARHRVLPETAHRALAKADLRKPELSETEWKQRLGSALRQVRGTLTLNELSGRLGRDERQIARWERGEETPQVALYFAQADLRLRMVLELAKLAGGVECETVLRLRMEIA